MPLTTSTLKTEISTSKDYSPLDQKAWEAKIAVRAIDFKFDEDIERFIPMYVNKINACRELLQEADNGIKIAPYDKEGRIKDSETIVKEFNSQIGEFQAAYDKEQRLIDKLACCLKEQELRKDKLVIRTPHHTDYYIDYTNGNDSNDGLSADNSHSWKSINKYTTTTVRSAGDRAFVRANQTHDCSAADIVGDEDGTIDAWISIIGCDATTNDPWNDDSDVKPTIDFGGNNYNFSLNGDGYWWLERLKITNGSDSEGLMYLGGSSPSNITLYKIKDCDFSGNSNTNGEGVRAVTTLVDFEGCTFSDTKAAQIDVTSSLVFVTNCTFNAGVSGNASAYGIVVNGDVYVNNSSFGGTSAFSTAAFNFNSNSSGQAFLRNCTYSGTLAYFATAANNSTLYVEDDNGIYGSHLQRTLNGTISKETASPRAGGSLSYAKMLPTASCGPNYPLVLGLPLQGFSPVWLIKDIEYTLTVYARVGSAWDSALSASEAYLKCSYLSNASTAARTEVQSTETIANDTTWTAFTVTFTPLQTGFAYLWFCLAEYEDDTEYIDVDDEPVVS